MKANCSAQTKSVAVPGHTHTCIGVHDEDGDHFCRECGRWWWVRDA